MGVAGNVGWSIVLICAALVIGSFSGQAVSALDVHPRPAAGIDADFDGDGALDTSSMTFDRKADVIDVSVKAQGRQAYKAEFPLSELHWSVVGADKACPTRRKRLLAMALDVAARADFMLMSEMPGSTLVQNGKTEAVMVPNGETDPLWSC